jgi:aspartyl-tRNA(Asn)/glutamyl-tRNA(Gln) amidotransferase subunit B
MRCDANVSVRPLGEAEMRTRTEIKNVNSVRFVMQAIAYEAERQVEVYEGGGEVVQETRLFDSGRGETRAMRTKEHAHDYRYFPDPDLLPLDLDEADIERLRADLPELPDSRKARFVESYGLTPYDAGVLVAERETAEYFEAVAEGRDAKAAANWITGELFAVLNKLGRDIAASPVSAEDLGRLIDLIADDTISGRIAKDVFEAMVETGADPASIVDEKGLRQITDSGAIEAIVERLVADNAEQVAQFQGGNEKVIGWFVGQVMKETQGKANPKAVNELLRAKLEG